RRYVESLSAYARQFLEQMEKPEVDSIEGLSPAISIEQKTTSKNPRSTVGTVTEIYDYLRVLFARIGVPHCPSCGRVISAQTVQKLADGVVQVEPVEGKPDANMLFSERLACAECGIPFPEVSPRMFSFNNPFGACPDCSGIGTRYEIDPERLVPNVNRSLKQGALAPWAGRESAYFRQTLAALAKRYRVDLEAPWSKLKKGVRDI